MLCTSIIKCNITFLLFFCAMFMNTDSHQYFIWNTKYWYITENIIINVILISYGNSIPNESAYSKTLHHAKTLNGWSRVRNETASFTCSRQSN